MKKDLIPQTFHCVQCGFFSSRLPILINSVDRIDEDVREHALKPVRAENYRQMLDEIARLLPREAKLLDVGCAHGWFLQAAKERGLDGCGIEPDEQMAKRARDAGLKVISGFFPGDLSGGQKFGIIVFNDVFEHLPDVNGMARALLDHLEPSGIVIVNLPVSDGLIFRMARVAARMRMTGPLVRMWQLGMPSPHLSYFNEPTLVTVFGRAGFELIHHGELQSIRARGLYQRIRYDKQVTTAKAAGLYAAACGVGLVSRMFSSDTQFFVFRAAQ